ncbi:hypothetical protein LBMAG42_15630 [Deltaproteobacteria bacterium]|nr:hypothetical protein LBMAG42_15630 [Deltaproteobacteria bacterium]
MAKPPLKFLERVGANVVRGASARPASEGGDAVHVLNERERAELLRIERVAVIRAGLAGVLAALVCAAAEIAAHPLLGPEEVPASSEQLFRFWGVFGAAMALVSATEIAFLYWSSLAAVRELAHAAGLLLHGDESHDTAVALARAALELPTPLDPSFGVNPQREASRVQLLFASLAYKAKVAVSNFVFKAVVRRALGRAATRYLLAFTAIPVNAAWNAIVAWLVIREARIRVLGPSAAEEMLAVVLAANPEPSAACKAVLHKSVGAAVVRKRDMHPNLVGMMRLLRLHLGPPEAGTVLDRPDRFLTALAGLPPEEQKTVVRCLTIATVLDGRLARAERRLLREARAAAGLDDSLSAARALRRDFTSGEAIPAEAVLATA